jgi:hypothetical protein
MPRMLKDKTATSVPCLAPNIPLTQHIHATLNITVDGAAEPIPANIGLASCERALHTHDETGPLHVEAQDTRAYTLGDFFSVWNKGIERAGYEVGMTVNGQPSAEMGNLVLQDGQTITLTYAKNQ